MKPDSTASTAIRIENSLVCPSRNPTSREISFCSTALVRNSLNTKGFMTITDTASNIAGSIIFGTISRLNVAPSAKKKIIRKKSRKGLSLSVINNAMGHEASVIPAIKAPISC